MQCLLDINTRPTLEECVIIVKRCHSGRPGQSCAQFGSRMLPEESVIVVRQPVPLRPSRHQLPWTHRRSVSAPACFWLNRTFAVRSMLAYGQLLLCGAKFRTVSEHATFRKIPHPSATIDNDDSVFYGL